MTENEKLRALLAEARYAVRHSINAWSRDGYEENSIDEDMLLGRIDAALAEPPEGT
jgi:hypothetical protein